MFKGPDDNVAWASPSSRQQSSLSHSSWATLPDGTHACCQAVENARRDLPAYSKIRVHSSPLCYQLTPVRLSCIILGKEANSYSHTTMMCGAPTPQAISQTCTCTLRHAASQAAALEPYVLQESSTYKENTQTEKEILQFSATPSTLGIF